MQDFGKLNLAFARQLHGSISLDYRHPAWTRDSITDSTGGESMRISTVRQLSRTLGTTLADITRDSSAARSYVEEILGYRPKVEVYSTLLNMTVGAIFDAPNFKTSTTSVVCAWTELARENDLKTPLLLLGLVAVTRDASTEMLQDLLSKPAVGNTNESRDGSIRTVFGVRGEVSEINIRVLNGAFSRALSEALSKADSTYQHYRRELQAAGGKAIPVAPEVTHVTLAIDHSFQRADDLHSFQVTSADFIQAYITATFDYAAGAYADRVRSGKA